MNGRVFEANRQQEIVWEFFVPHLSVAVDPDTSDQTMDARQTLFRMHRLDPDDFSGLATGPGARVHSQSAASAENRLPPPR